jgi:hypothetical protein
LGCSGKPTAISDCLPEEGIENYLYLAVTSFGVFAVIKTAGAFMIIIGITLGITGYALWSIAREKSVKNNSWRKLY